MPTVEIRGRQEAAPMLIPAPKTQRPHHSMRPLLSWVPDNDLLSHARMRTIIGVLLFHGPVRDGKEWSQQAMVVRRRRREGKNWVVESRRTVYKKARTVMESSLTSD